MKVVVQENIEGKELSAVSFDKKRTMTPKISVDLNEFNDVIEQPSFFEVNEAVEEHFLTSAYERVINISGRFKQEAIALGLSELR